MAYFSFGGEKDPCGAVEWAAHASSMVPLQNCKRDMSSWLKEKYGGSGASGSRGRPTSKSSGGEAVISEWELILNRAGIACDEVDSTRFIICPKLRFKLTTLYKAKDKCCHPLHEENKKLQRYGSVISQSGQSRDFCGVKEPFAVLILGSYVEVRVRMYGYDTALKARYFVMNNTGSDASYQHGWNVTVDSINSTVVYVSWTHLNTTGLNFTYIYGYTAVPLHNVTNNILVMNLENTSSSYAVVQNLRPYSSYRVKVFALVRDVVTGATTLRSSKNIDIRTQEDVPGAISWVNAYSRDSNSLEIEWSSIPEEDTHGVLLGYVVYFKRYNSNENFTIVHVNASTRVLRIADLMEATTYEIRVTGRTSAGEGPPYYTRENTGS
ncbi:hypothetical protein ACROYT_G040813 [Oculina patagonica]